MHSAGKDLVLGVEVVCILVAVDPQQPLEPVEDGAGARPRPPLLTLHQAGVRPPHRPQPSLVLGGEHQTGVCHNSGSSTTCIIANTWQKWAENAENVNPSKK